MAKTIEELYEIINDLRATVDKISKENEELKASNAQKDAEIKDLKKKLYGTGKSEKIDPRQEELFDKDEVELRIPEQKDILVKVSSEYFRKAGKPKRLTKEEKYGHLPTLEEIEYIPEEVKNNPQRYEVIGEETTFEICPTQRQYLKRVHKRIRFREKESHKKAPLLAPAPKQLVQGSICSVEWVSQIIIDKYLDHLPLDRQCKIAERSGIKVTVKNMYDWLGKAADAFEGVYDEILKKLKSENYLQADETPIDYLEGKKPPDPEKVKGSKIGYFWLINAPNDYVLYHWATSRAAKVITDLLGKNWKGLLQCDGYSSYKSYGNKNTNLRLGACLVHIRRKFITAYEKGERRYSPRILKRIAELYRLETSWRMGTDKTRQNKRADQSRFILDHIKSNIDYIISKNKVLPESEIGKAVKYASNQWNELIEYLEDGRILPDNNLIENAVRPTKLGLKNWLFIGHKNAGKRAAIFYTIVENCKRLKIDTYHYMTSVLKVAIQSNSLDEVDYEKLLPQAWSRSQQQQQGPELSAA